MKCNVKEMCLEVVFKTGKAKLTKNITLNAILTDTAKFLSQKKTASSHFQHIF